ncbi:glycosyltransferase [Pseudalkalibacillus caeni]|uniref:Glycosyltransferase n=1 Tax=Exobacillus caeni TaxID=2574798 RepID=A0A5R9F0W7_9BACL|nr:glycosyltransferase family 2 protein [Pseudalkalibacillus caeni]TLS36076.1 glycosyltransferase [Pseudalkalibacillus caeni]
MLITYSIILGLFFVWTVINSSFLPSLLRKSAALPPGAKKVSILIPLRNEERNVPALVKSLKQLTYPNLEIIMLNDNSTDRTGELLEENTKNDSRFHIEQGTVLPDGWNGKVHACFQLGEYATGDYLLFIDADIELSPNVVQKCLQLLREEKAGLLTGFPRFPVTSILQQWLVPLQHFLVLFHLPIWPANNTTRKEYTAAHGAFMLFTREAYVKSGGHAAIRDSLVDDVHLARRVKENGYKGILCSLVSDVRCNMYENNHEAWNGFTKNLFPGLGRSVVFVILISAFYLLFYFLPLPLAILGIYEGVGKGDWKVTYFLPLLFIWLQKLWVDIKAKQNPFLFLWMPLASLAFVVLMYRSMIYGLRKSGYQWKGRTYS